MNALVSYASDSDSDSDSGEGHYTSTVVKTTTLSTSLSATPAGATPSTTDAPKGTLTGEQEQTLQEEDGVPKDTQELQEQQGNSDEDDFVSAALKDLQSFAALIDSAPQGHDSTPPVTEPTAALLITHTKAPISPILSTQPAQESGCPDATDMDIDQEQPSNTTATFSPLLATPIELSPNQQLIFETFLQEIDAIPLTPLDQTYPPGYSHPNHTASNSDKDDEHWIRTQTPQTLYSRVHQLSTIPRSEKFDPKEVENRLIEFAIRLLDWEQGGLKQSYFLGEERAQAVLERKEAVEQRRARRKEEQELKSPGSANESSDDDGIEDDEGYEGEKQTSPGEVLPLYGGVVGEMIEFMRAIEQVVLPDHWTVTWNIKDLCYKFCHAATGTESEEYPSAELQHRLDPSSSSSPVAIVTTKHQPPPE